MTDPGRAVFLSYASQDAAAAERLCNSLRRAGIEVWFDQSELRGGDAWDQKIRREIRDCALFVPLISANTAARPEGYFRLEWSLADGRSHMIARNKPFIVPVCIDTTPESAADVPESFQRVQWTRLTDGDTPPTCTARIAALLGAPNEPAPRANAESSGVRSGTIAASVSVRNATVRSTALVRFAVVAIVIALTVSLAYLAFERFQPQVRTAVDQRIAAVAPALTEPIIPEKSVAVLPFVDMSEKKDQEYFSDGMSEELIDMLSKIPELRVPARTSSFYFKGKPTTIAEIAKTLRVAYVLEGSVRKFGKTLRVTAQLIKAESGYHLWSNSYDRAFDDVFKVQDEIANAVVKALKLTLSAPAVASASSRTLNTEAYEQFLIGRQFLARTGVDNYRLAEEAFRKAVALDPTFAAAYASLSDAQYLIEADVGRLSPTDYQRILAELNRAIELAPNLSDGYSERGIDQLEYFGDLQAAHVDLSRALELDPSNSANLRRFGVLQRCLGNVGEAVVYGKKATDIDPLDVFAWLHLGEAYAASHNYPEAADALLKAVQISPESPVASMGLFDVWLLQGRADEVLRSVERLREPIYSLPYRAMAEFTLGNERESRKALEEFIELVDKQSFFFAGWETVATIYAWRGERQKALDWLERAASQGNGGIACITSDPFYASFHDDPRFKALLRRLNLPE